MDNGESMRTADAEDDVWVNTRMSGLASPMSSFDVEDMDVRQECRGYLSVRHVECSVCGGTKDSEAKIQ